MQTPPGEMAGEARREEEAEERLLPAAQEGGAVARESEGLLGGYPTAGLDLPPTCTMTPWTMMTWPPPPT